MGPTQDAETLTLGPDACFRQPLFLPPVVCHVGAGNDILLSFLFLCNLLLFL